MPPTRRATVVVDPALCAGCGACVAVCPSRTIAMVDGVAQVVGEQSMHCGHCEAVCPSGAVTRSGVDPEALAFRSLAFDDRWLPPEELDPAWVVRLLASRRSCRDYTEEPVERAVLEDLVRAGITAPSGTNSQTWTFTLVPDRAGMVALGDRIRAYFERLERLAGNSLLRNALRLVGRSELHVYHHQYSATIREALDEYHRDGTDRLWHGATAAIVVASRPGGSCGAEDALLASQNILLTAHAMGLGTCLIGYAVETMRRDPAVKRSLGIPDEETVHSVVALGHTRERYERCAGRLAPTLRWVETPQG